MRYVLAILLLFGCGQKAMQRHLLTAQTSKSAIELSAEIIEATCTVEALRASREPDRLISRCRRAQAAQNLSVDLWRAYVDALVLEGLGSPQVEGYLRTLAETYQTLSGLIEELGGSLPRLERREQ